jgi:hypothetical protein
VSLWMQRSLWVGAACGDEAGDRELLNAGLKRKASAS